MKLFAVLLLSVAPAFGQGIVGPPRVDDSEFVHATLYPATALLYSQEQDGNMKMRCTATAIGKNATGYVFVTAAHCGCVDDDDKKTVSPEKTFFYVTADDKDQKNFTKAKVTGCGYRHRGDDFMLLQVDTKADYPTVRLGEDPAVLEPVVNVASPLGLGKQVFKGSVSAAAVDRPIVEGDINWTGAILLQLFGVDGGSSGSSVVCLNQQAICSFVVGTVDKTTMVAMPVSRLKALQKGLADKTYKYWVQDPDSVRNAAPEKSPKVNSNMMSGFDVTYGSKVSRLPGGPALGSEEAPHTELRIPRACIKSVELTDHTTCHGADKHSLSCTGLVLTYVPDCEQVQVTKR